MNIVICEAELGTRSQIKDCIMSEDMDVSIREISSTDELSGKQNMDMIFLDLKQGEKNGIRVVKKLRREGVDIPIIFVAETKDYVFDAFDVKAFQYLVKPLERDTLSYVYQRAKEQILKKSCHAERTLSFHTKKMNYFLKMSQIYYAENDGKKIILHTEKGVIVIYGTMQSLAKRLDTSFFRSHRGYLVNMNHIVGYNRDSIRMDNGDSIFLSRDKYSDFVKTYMEFGGAQ